MQFWTRWTLPLLMLLSTAVMTTGCVLTQDTGPSLEETSSSSRDPQVCKIWKEVTTAQNYDGKQQKGEDTEETSRQIDNLNLARDIYCPRTSSKRAGT